MRFRKTVKGVFLTLVLGILVGVLAAIIPFGLFLYYVLYNRGNLPDINVLIKFEPPVIGTIYDERERPIINLANEFRWIVRPEEITPIIKQAVLSAEDRDFYRHNGVDWYAFLVRAAGENITSSVETWLRQRKITLVTQQGASTITDQLVGLYYRDHIRNTVDSLQEGWWGFISEKFLKKAEELRLAIWVEEEFRKSEHFGSKQRAKEEILARYLSSANLRYVYGIKAAAVFYFGRDVNTFDFKDADKAAFIAGVIKSPSGYAPTINQQKDNLSFAVLRQINRRNAVLDLMVENGYLSEKEAAQFKEREIPIPTRDVRNSTEYPTVVTETFSEIRQKNVAPNEVYNGDVQTHTTVNAEIQGISQDACENVILEYGKRYPEHKDKIQCSAIVLKNGDAAILAIVGGRKVYGEKIYLPGELNRVNQARQVGSAFKPFVYLTASRQGRDLNKIIANFDSPIGIDMGNGRIHPVDNYDRRFLGDMSPCEALYRSRNAPTVRLTKDILGYGYFENSGMKHVIDTARLLGIKSPFHTAVDHLGRTVYYPTSALGASEMTLKELTNAYREIASGISAKPYIVRKITDRSGGVVLDKSEDRKISEIAPEALAMIRHCLRKVVTAPGGTAYSLTLENFPVPIAGKTGTVDEFRNALFIGFTYGFEGITVGAWINFDDNLELGEGETGSRTALPAVKEIFARIYERNILGPPPEFPEYTPEYTFIESNPR